MEQKDLIGYLTGEKELPTRPEMTAIPPFSPSLEALREKNRSRERDSQTEGDQASQENIDPNAPATPAEKTALKQWKEEYTQELSHFNTLLTYFRTQESRYEAKRKKMDDIAQWIQSSVSNDIKDACLGLGINVRIEAILWPYGHDHCLPNWTRVQSTHEGASTVAKGYQLLDNPVDVYHATRKTT